jgi:hypothetical protein
MNNSPEAKSITLTERQWSAICIKLCGGELSTHGQQILIEAIQALLPQHRIFKNE